MSQFNDNDLAALVYELLQRRGEGTYVPRRQVELDGWRPVEQSCHANVDHWVANSPGTAIVRGFLDFSLTRQFLPHSVVGVADGTLIDITPQHPNASHYRFIPYVGSDELFDFARQHTIIRF